MQIDGWKMKFAFGAKGLFSGTKCWFLRRVSCKKVGSLLMSVDSTFLIGFFNVHFGQDSKKLKNKLLAVVWWLKLTRLASIQVSYSQDKDVNRTWKIEAVVWIKHIKTLYIILLLMPEILHQLILPLKRWGFSTLPRWFYRNPPGTCWLRIPRQGAPSPWHTSELPLSTMRTLERQNRGKTSGWSNPVSFKSVNIAEGII